MIKRTIALLAVMLIMVSVIAGCSTQGDGESSETNSVAEPTVTQKPVKLNMTYWQPENKDVMEQMNTAFTEQNSNITIELQQIPGDQYDKVLQTRFLSDNAPDVLFYYGGRIYQLGGKGQLGEITDEPFADNIIEGYKAPSTWENKLYGVSLNAWAACVIYNKTVFTDAGITEIPKNYGEFLAACEKIKAIGVTPIARGGKDSWTGSVEMLSLYNSSITSKYTDLQSDRYTGKIKFATSPYVKGFLEDYIELYDKGYMDKGALGLNHSQAAQQIADGKAAMFLGISVFWGDIVANNAEVELGAFMLPDAEGNFGYCGSVDKAIAYSANGKNKDAAIKVLAFYATPETNKLFCDSTQMFPCIKGTDVALSEPLKAVAKQLDSATVVNDGIDFQWPPAATDAFRNAIQGIHAGNKDVAKILTDVDKAYDDNISTITAPAIK